MKSMVQPVIGRAESGERKRRDGGAAIGRCDIAICAWGAHPMAGNRDRAVRSLLRSYRPAVFCLGTTKAGAPKHPLYIKSGTPLQTFGA
jgi:hypothetical protein